MSEYFLFDPKGEYLTPPLQGMRLRGSEYEPMAPERVGDGMEGVWSETLGLYLCRRGQALRLYDPATGRVFLTHREEAAARQREAAARQQEAAARRAAEARVAELEALLSSGGIPVPPEKRRP